MQTLISITFICFLFIVIVSPYHARPYETFGFSHAGLFILSIYAAEVNRSDIALLSLVAAVCSIAWHSGISAMEMADEITAHTLMIYTVVSLAFPTPYIEVAIASLATAIVSVYISNAIGIIIGLVAIAIKRPPLFWYDVVLASVFAVISITQFYHGTSRGHALWHSFGAVAVAFAATAREDSQWHLLGLTHIPYVSEVSAVSEVSEVPLQPGSKNKLTF